MLHDVIPEAMRPYSLLHSFTTDSYQMITSLTYHGNDKLIAGSRDCNVSVNKACIPKGAYEPPPPYSFAALVSS